MIISRDGNLQLFHLRRRIAASICLSASAIAAATTFSGCAGSKRYSVAELETAFRAHGVRLGVAAAAGTGARRVTVLIDLRRPPPAYAFALGSLAHAGIRYYILLGSQHSARRGKLVVVWNSRYSRAVKAVLDGLTSAA